ncbi:Na+/H+ antiporter subunit D [Oricola cellulosilytica]|uniref:Na+/H+ antiporter subunit D n=1 Tax=Oricola cellulosilytica TaxID=1429082 RepID=A0A4R0PA15_9HYPH|nr:Na+/H+ antiporter subunit D [Oricola cellulosilytica]TCD14090.1 Na+/H+ antiporter subunit D [Oricola cellulosilytica]
MALDASYDVDISQAMVVELPPLADWLVVAPLVVGFVFGALCLMTRKDTGRQPFVAITGLLAMLAADIGLFWHVYTNGTVVMTMGRWLPPFGITFAADMLGALLALVTGILGFAGGVYALQDISRTGRRYGFYPFLLLMLSGVTAAFLTGDIFNLYVWFEVLLIASFGLLVLGSEREQLDGATKYAFLNLIATTLFLLAVAYIYGVFGTLNMADISRKAASVRDSGPLFTITAMLLFAFAMKAAAFPLNFWLPASYHTPRIVVSGLFAGLLTKVGVYALLRIFLTLFGAERDILAGTIAVIAALTMVLGAMGALAQNDIRRLLGYLVISGIGSMLAGLALGSATGLSGAVLYAVHSMIVMTALYFLVGIMVERMKVFTLREAGGLYSSAPWLAALALMLFLSVSGLPPFSGLWPKALLVKASLDVGAWWLAFAILLSGLLTTIAVARVFAFSFWRERDTAQKGAGEVQPAPAATSGAMAGSLTALLLLTVAVGVYPEPVVRVTDRIAAELKAPSRYVEAVFPPGSEPLTTEQTEP